MHTIYFLEQMHALYLDQMQTMLLEQMNDLCLEQMLGSPFSRCVSFSSFCHAFRVIKRNAQVVTKLGGREGGNKLRGGAQGWDCATGRPPRGLPKLGEASLQEASKRPA